MLDLERIIQTGIPDIAPVYGGVRGRTISSHKQAYAWKTVVAAGLRLVIDLRKDYSADRYPELCRQYGVDYFHYPIDNDRETISKMVEMFPTLCEKIDKGYIEIAFVNLFTERTSRYAPIGCSMQLIKVCSTIH